MQAYNVIMANRKISNLTKKFGKKIRIERTKQNISQETLAHHANLCRTSLSAIENGTRVPNIETANNIAHALNIPLKKLLKELSDIRTTL